MLELTKRDNTIFNASIKSKKEKNMKKETIHQHVRRIGELHNAVSELALCEHKRIEDYTPAELVATAENVLDIMGDWFEDEDIAGDRRHLAAERRKLQNFIKKWRATA